MTSQGSPYTRFTRALATGNLLLVRAAAAELPKIDLADALRIRMLGRLCLEHRELGFDDLAQGLAGFQALAFQPESALRALGGLCSRVGIDARALG